MAELVEGARLEIVYTGNRIKGSNPFLSARKVPDLGDFFHTFIFILVLKWQDFTVRAIAIANAGFRDIR